MKYLFITFIILVNLFFYMLIFSETSWDLKKIDTTTKADYLNKLEKDIIIELNKVRTNPQLYAKTIVAEVEKYYDGNLLKYPGEINLRTTEGISAVKECYEVLLKAKPVSVLYPAKGLSLSAKDLVNDQSVSGGVGHTASDGSTPKTRILRYGKYISLWGENIYYGSNIAQRVVLFLLIDDGVPSRGHRENILLKDFKVVGVSCGKHKKYEYMCVMDFAGGFKDKI